MKRPGMTALGIAAVRALERERPPAERIVDDPYARHFVGEYTYRLLTTFDKMGWSERRGPGVVGYLLARERAIDDMLLREVDAGSKQLVILGAGYDARAYRFNRKLADVAVFEVDEPATQADKRAKVERFADELAHPVCYVPLDFDAQQSGEELLRAGYEPSLRTLFIAQGVIMYLHPAAVDATLDFMRTHAAPGSAVVLDYVADSAISGAGAHAEVRRTNQYGRFSGERVQFGLDPDAAAAWLRARGFVDVEHTRSEELHTRYFTGDNAARSVASGYGILLGRVG